MILSLVIIALTLGTGCASNAAVPAEAPTTARSAVPAETLTTAGAAVPGESPTTTMATGPRAAAAGGTEATPEKEAIPVGASVGKTAPGFAILLVDGTTVTSQELALEGKPAFLMFFATW
jgi:hypothetical protein